LALRSLYFYSIAAICLMIYKQFVSKSVLFNYYILLQAVRKKVHHLLASRITATMNNAIFTMCTFQT
ncbi:hypothetical protein C1Y18_36505, partial [Pseudomonas sp. MPR-R5A]